MITTARIRACSAAVFVAIALPGWLGAQSLWLDQRLGKAVALEVLKPVFDRDGAFDGSGFATTVWYASLWLPLKDRVRLVVELPLAHVVTDFGSSNGAGNVYAGVEVGLGNSPLVGELGVRLPTAETGFFLFGPGPVTDLDRWEAFTDWWTPISAALNLHQRTPAGVSVRLRVGPSVWISHGVPDLGDVTPERVDSELYLVYGAQVGLERRMVSVVAGLTGRTLVTEADPDPGERSHRQLAASASFGTGQVRPGVQLRVPVNQRLADEVNYVLGLHLAVALK